MRKRQIQIGLVKESNKNEDSPPDYGPGFLGENADTIANLSQGIGTTFIAGVVVYMTFDTIRKIAVSRLSK